MDEVHDIMNRFESEVYKNYNKNIYLVKSKPIYEDVEDALNKAIQKGDGRDIFKYTQLKKQLQEKHKGPEYNRKYYKRFIVKQPEIDKRDSVKAHALEFILKKLPFNIYDECVSKQRSKKYYISKENLVKMVSESIELQSLFKNKKKDYKKLNKEEICKEIFNKN